MFPPNFADFLSFVRNDMGISSAVLPDDSTSLVVSFGKASEFIPSCLACAEIMYSYTDALLNLGGAYLIQSATDVAGSTFFNDLRTAFKMTGAFRSGVITSSADAGTSASTAVGSAMQNLSLADLQLLQTPYGRSALAFLQEMGTPWGLS